MESNDILKIAVKALDDKKAHDIKVIKVDDLTVLADYFVIATGNSNTQVRALADEVDYKLSESGVQPHHIEGKSSGWILLDYSSVVVHVFYKDAREFYSLERLWQDGTDVDVNELL
ncbi:MAG: ribosome silencing factor [Clostridia bacterium]|nr:ribosome silencing factor [Clostridia bacterium]